MTNETAILLCVIAIPLFWLAYECSKILYFVKRIYNREIDDDHLFHHEDCLCDVCVTQKEIYPATDVMNPNRYFDKKGSLVGDCTFAIYDVHRHLYISKVDNLALTEIQFTHNFLKAARYESYGMCEAIIGNIKQGDLDRANNHQTNYEERFFQIIKVY